MEVSLSLGGLLFVVALAPTLTACGSSGDGSTALQVKFENIAAADAIMASDGTTPPVDYAPGLWAVHDPNPFLLFQTGQPASAGLERLAEDGNPGPISPVVAASAGVHSSGIFSAVNATTYAMGPIGPGLSDTFSITVKAGEHLSIATMFAQANDIFAAAVDFDPLPGGSPAGDVTSEFHYYDAGTEVNQEPGIGSNQPAGNRQGMPNTGPDEHGVVTQLTDNMDKAGYSYPAIADTMRVTISAASH